MRMYVRPQELVRGDMIRRAYSINGMALDNFVVDRVVMTDEAAIVHSGELSFKLNPEEDIKITRKLPK